MIIDLVNEDFFENVPPAEIKQFVKNLNDIDLRKAEPKGKGWVFVPTNGAGLGHLTRLLAIARRVKKRSPGKEIIFFTTSSALGLIEREGFKVYYLPSRSLLPKEVTAGQWNTWLQEELGKVLRFYTAEMMVFDGAQPYSGIISCMNEFPGMKKVWVNRGMSREQAEIKSMERGTCFDCMIRPGEAGKKVDREQGYHCFDPVIYLDRSELMDRKKVRELWKVPETYKLMYVQLGAGNINDIMPVISSILSYLKKRNDIFIVFGESVIGSRLDISGERTLILKDYPNSRFFNAFDLAISACGYNTFHELLYFGTPSIFVPNRNTRKDDQVARAMNAVNNQAALLWDGTDEMKLNAVIREALEKRDRIIRNAQSLIRNNGADQIAEFLLKLPGK